MWLGGVCQGGEQQQGHVIEDPGGVVGGVEHHVPEVDEESSVAVHCSALHCTAV